MQAGQELKWRRDQRGNWTRIDVTSKPVANPATLRRKDTPIPTVTFRVRTGKSIACMDAQSGIAALSSGASLSIHRDPTNKPITIATSAQINAICLSTSTVAVAMDDGHVAEYESATGRTLGVSPDLGGNPMFLQALASDGFVATLESGAIVAMSAKLAPKWRFVPPAGTFGFQGAVSVGRGVYVPGESTLYRLDAVSGLVNWSVELGERGCITPVVTAGLAISAATSGGITCLDAATGKLRWRIPADKTGSSSWSGINSAGQQLVAATQQGDVICINRENGRIEWVRSGIGRVLFAPIGDVKHGCAVVFVQDTDAGIPAEVLGLDLRSGRTNWRARVGNLDAAPVLTGDRLWVASVTGTLYAFDYG